MPTPIATSGIAAEAFELVELAPIASFSDDTPQAQDAALYYPFALRAALEAGDWSFASSLVALPALAALPAGIAADEDLPHVYALPGDCAMLREVRPKTCAYRLDEGLLRSDAAAPLTIRYTRIVTDETKVSEQFRHTVALLLAARLAPRWLGNQTKREAIEARAANSLRNAGRTDARTASPVDNDPLSSADWVDWALR